MTDTKHKILATARELFATRGYEATSIRDIVSRAGVNLGAITYHFGSKRRLFYAVIEGITKPVRERLEGPLPSGDALDVIERYMRANWEFLIANRDLPRIILHTLATAGRIPAPGARLIKLNFETVVRLIRRGQRQGRIRSGDPRNVAMSVMGQPLLLAFYQKALQQCVGFNPLGRNRHRVIDDVVSLVRNGLAVPRGGK